MSIRVLRAGLDTVEISLFGSFSEEAIERLDRAKTVAAATGRPRSFEVGITELTMEPKAFGFWSWQLKEPRFHIVGKRNAPQGAVVAQVRFSAFGLANEDPSMLWLLILSILGELGNFSELAISRADVCVDFQGWTPTPSDMSAVVCPANYRGTHGTEKETQTFVFGKRTLLRIYNKSAEILVSKKPWVPDLWRQSESYVESDSVWRAEFQTTSEVIKQLGISCAAELFESPGALLDYGLTWAQLRVPTADTTKTRWPEDPRWTALRKATFDGIPLQRRIKPSELMSLDGAKSRLVGLTALAGAYFGTDDYLSALQQLSFAAEVHMMREGIDFADLVEEKRLRIISGDH